MAIAAPNIATIVIPTTVRDNHELGWFWVSLRIVPAQAVADVRAMTLDQVTLRDWWKVMRREVFPKR